MQTKEQLGVDWSGCSLVETNPNKVSGVPILKGTRVQADAVVLNFDSGSSVDEISENFGIPVRSIELVLRYTGRLSQNYK